MRLTSVDPCPGTISTLSNVSTDHGFISKFAKARLTVVPDMPCVDNDGDDADYGDSYAFLSRPARSVLVAFVQTSLKQNNVKKSTS